MKHRPIGGVKVIYQHCLLLKKLGYNVFPVLMGEYVGNFYNYELDFIKYSDAKKRVNSHDVVVVPEFSPYLGGLFPEARRVLFLQNWLGLKKWLKDEDINKTYLDLGYDHVITCSHYCSDYVMRYMGISATTVTNGIELEKFHPNPSLRIGKRVLAMSRKNPIDLDRLKNYLNNLDCDLIVVDSLTEEQLIKEYQSSDIFIALGYPEGFGLPPLEAMACGCVVIGFTGGGASEFMIDGETALVAKDGDIESLSQKLKSVLDDESLKEMIREKGYLKSQEYGLDTTKKEINEFFKLIVDCRKTSVKKL